MDRGVKLFFDRLVWFTRIAGSRRLTGKDIDQRGFHGAVNIVLTPDPAAAWHYLFSDSGFRLHRGRHPQPIGTVTLDEDLFLKLLAGLTSYYTAEMTGKIRVEGDGHSAWILSSTILQAHTQARRNGFFGWFTRWHLRRVLRRSNKGYELQIESKSASHRGGSRIED